MIIGIDFDNTIVCYDALFHRVARERGLIPADLHVNKTAVRDHLRATGREDIWTAIQGEVYGARMAEAAPYPGVHDFFRACRERGIAVRIISHKTLHPYLGEKYDLHATAQNWLRLQGFYDPAQLGLHADDVFFELTKTAKLQRIASCGCTHFIDDLPELLTTPEFPASAVRLLFDPENIHPDSQAYQRNASWSQLQAQILPEEPWLQTALDLAGQRGADVSALPLHGGANNRVFRLGETAVVKRYFQHANDPRDRYATEKAFYDYAATTAPNHVPEVLGWNDEQRLGVFEFVHGQRPSYVSEAQIGAALKFFRQLNKPCATSKVSTLPLAAEACLSLNAHLATVQRRVTAVASLPQANVLDAAAAAFVSDVLQPLWENLQQSLITSLSDAERQTELPTSCRCISPSDFGFHNALVRDNGSLVFFDFEYAGWDDPAKLVSDFFCQPEVPVPHAYFDQVVASVAQSLPLAKPNAFATRCRCLLPVYQVKWSCILLNDFTEIGRRRREFSLGPAEAAARRQRQLARARQMLGSTLIPA